MPTNHNVKAHRLPGLYTIEDPETHFNTLATKCTNTTDQATPFTDEKIIEIEEEKYRTWNPFQSTIAAAAVGGIMQLGGASSSSPPSNITTTLYLGSRLSASAIHIAEMMNNNVSSSSSSAQNIVLPVVFQNLDTTVRGYSPEDIENIQKCLTNGDDEGAAIACQQRLDSDIDDNGNARHWEMDVSEFNRRYFSSTVSDGSAARTSAPPSNLAKPIIVSDTEKQEVHGSKYAQEIESFVYEKITTTHQQQQNQQHHQVFDAMFVEVFGLDMNTIVDNFVVPSSELFLRPGAIIVMLMDADVDQQQQQQDSQEEMQQQQQPHDVYAKYVQVMKENGFKPREQLTLEPYFKSKAILVCVKQ